VKCIKLIGGSEPGEGAIVSHNGSKTGHAAHDSDIFSLFTTSMDGDKNGGWFVVQTNTDHQLPAPIYP